MQSFYLNVICELSFKQRMTTSVKGAPKNMDLQEIVENKSKEITLNSPQNQQLVFFIWMYLP